MQTFFKYNINYKHQLIKDAYINIMSTNSSVYASTTFDSSAWFAGRWTRMQLMLWLERSFTVAWTIVTESLPT